MKKALGIGMAAVLLLAMDVWPALAMDESSLNAGRFGSVHLYRRRPQPGHVVLFISGDGGWNLGVVEMARTLAGLDALVVGIDIIHYLKRLGQSNEPCLYPAADFESLSKFVQKSLGYSQYIQPVLVGYSSGATLVYALIGQAPAGTFKAGLSLGFCPDLPLARAPCKGSGLAWQPNPEKGIYVFSPAGHLETPWTALQGDIDQVCDARATREFVSKVPGARIVMLPKVGHGFSVSKNWLPQFKESFLRLTEKTAPTPSAGLSDLPLVEVPARESSRQQLAVMISGDGGWAGIDRQLADDFAAHGLSVVGLNSLKYFWSTRTPDGAARDLERILRHYLQIWQKERAILVGYSLGADVLPFMAARLPEALRAKIELIALLGPSRETAFEFHLSDWMGAGSRAKQYPLLPEVEKLQDLRTLCIYGEQENDSLCRDTLPATVTKIPFGGSHHFGGQYAGIVHAVIQTMQKN
jgi:type IV secretory pathway VirJ component